MRIVLKKHKYRSIGVQYKPMISDFSAIAMRDSKDVCYNTVYTNESIWYETFIIEYEEETEYDIDSSIHMSNEDESFSN